MADENVTASENTTETNEQAATHVRELLDCAGL